jgi:hypothetical protein
LVLLAQFASASWLWLLMNGGGFLTARSDTVYRATWASSGFRGLPIDQVATALNARLPLETPIRVAPSIDGQWAQRLKEGLYPRRVEPGAAITLEIKGGVPALVQTPRGPMVLTGKLPPAPAKVAPANTDFGRSWTRILVHLAAALGWGLALAVLLGRAWRAVPPAFPLWPATAVVAPVVYGLLGTAATLVQKPLPWQVLTWVGVALLPLAMVVTFRGKAVAIELRRRFDWVRQPETWGMIVLSAMLVRHMDLWPIIGWDGRSIWLYRAKQVVWNGYLTVADAVNPENFFSHMEYPLLYPTWLAHFASSGPVREREIAVGIMLLQVLLISCVWWLSRRRLGRLTGAAFTGAVYVICAGMSERGFADGFVMMFTLSMIFLLESEELEPFGWVAALGAALTKAEGLVFAGLAGAAFILLHPRFRAKPWRVRFLPILLLPLAATPALWAKAIAIRNQYADAKLPTTFKLVIDRMDIIWSGVAKLGRESSVVASLPAMLAVYLVLMYLGRRDPLARIFLLTTLGIVGFSVAVMMVTPYDVAGQVDTALGRLLLHSAFTGVAAVLVALTSPREPARPA